MNVQVCVTSTIKRISTKITHVLNKLELQELLTYLLILKLLFFISRMLVHVNKEVFDLIRIGYNKLGLGLYLELEIKIKPVDF